MDLILLLLILGVVAWRYFATRRRASILRAARMKLRSQFAGWDIYISAFDEAVIGFNHVSRQLLLGTPTSHQRYSFSSITSVELLRDGTAITTTNRTSQMLGAAVGELVAGPVGLLIGGLTASRRTSRRVGQIGLKIIVNDTLRPVYTIDFIRVDGFGADPRDKLVLHAARCAEHIHALLLNAVRETTMPSAQTTSLATEALLVREPANATT